MTNGHKDGIAPPPEGRPLCVYFPADLWFSDDPEEQLQATGICVACPLSLQCYNTALANNEQYGIWGGIPFPVRKRKGPQ